MMETISGLQDSGRETQWFHSGRVKGSQWKNRNGSKEGREDAQWFKRRGRDGHSGRKVRREGNEDMRGSQ